MAKHKVDLNADAGESYGPWPMGSDAKLFPLVTSVNLACGFHGGDPLTMARSVELAQAMDVRVGAHPGFPDLVGFGRRDMAVHPDELHSLVLYQLGALDAFLRARGLSMHHVKPHGALYLQMARNEATAQAVARAVHDFRTDLPLVVLSGAGGKVMRDAAEAYGVEPVLEAFPDRAYLAGGHLAPRSMANALIRDPQRAAERAVEMATRGTVSTLDGETAEVEADTFCIHGDNPEAAEIARAIRTALEAAGVEVAAF